MDGFLIVDQARPGPQNMAIDQAMLRLAGSIGRPIVRCYQWSEPTLSLGYFQKIVDRELHSESKPLSVVRRSTGGGAIVHHHDFTYSAAIPSSMLTAGIGASQDVYDTVHRKMVARLTPLLGEADLFAAPSQKRCGPCSFLCFERRSQGDVVSHGFKIMGSAQQRRHGALLQHGSLLLARSEFAPSLPGIGEIQRAAESTAFAPSHRGAITEAISILPQVSHDDLGYRFDTFCEDIRQSLTTFLHNELANTRLEELNLPLDDEVSRYVDPAWTNRR